MEHYVEKALAEARDALALDLARPGTTDALLEAAEYCANLLEGNQLVPLWDLPTAHIKAWRAQKESERDGWAIRNFLYDLTAQLKEKCQLI